ncbi:hypothetical protein [Selenomonas ruminantium]|nr:hypothetical protein [Selenomonas ruminantium]
MYDTLMALGDVTQPAPVFAMFTLALTIILMVQGAILISIGLTTLLSMALGYSPVPHGIDDIISFNIPSLSGSFAQLDIAGAWDYGIISIIFTFTMVELFDNILYAMPTTPIRLTRKIKSPKTN